MLLDEFFMWVGAISRVRFWYWFRLNMLTFPRGGVESSFRLLGFSPRPSAGRSPPGLWRTPMYKEKAMAREQPFEVDPRRTNVSA